MDVTLAEVIAKVEDPETKAILTGVTLPESLPMAEFLAKVLQACHQAAEQKNTEASLNSGDENYVGAYPLPGIEPKNQDKGKPPYNRIVYALIVHSPINLNNAISPNKP